MGLDLKLLPIHSSGQYSHEILQLECNRALFDEILNLKSIELGDSIPTYLSVGSDGECCYGDTKETPYGESLTYVRANQLKELNIPGPQGAYVNFLDDHIKIILYWH